MPGMRKAADTAVAALLRHLTAKRGPDRLDAPDLPSGHAPAASSEDDRDIPLDGCGPMPEQLKSRVRSCLQSLDSACIFDLRLSGLW